MKYKNYILLRLILLVLMSSFVVAQNSDGVLEYLRYLAHKITNENIPSESKEELEKKLPELREKVLEIIGLNPVYEKTPLNVKFVGKPFELMNCSFQRVVFESRPKVYVAAHLYIPKNVSFPVPAVIHVPGHERRDYNRAHPRTYAENGFVAIALPMVGEEGKVGAGWGKCGEYGPYKGHFNWYNTGYSAIGPAVWDGIRAIDFLLTLKDSSGAKLVNESKIGIAGFSGGSARTLWTTIVEPRISCAVVSSGVTAIEHYDKPNGISSTCDIHLFYNYFGLSYGEIYSLIAPRPLLIQNGTEDNLYPNPQPVINYLSEIYKLYGKDEHFEYKIYNQEHSYDGGIWEAENEWMNKWLHNGNLKIKKYGKFSTELSCFPKGEPSDMVHIEQLYTPSTPVWDINNLEEFKSYKANLMQQLKTKVIPNAFKEIETQFKTIKKETFEEYCLEEKRLSLGEGAINHTGYFFYKPGEKRKTVIFLDKDSLIKSDLINLYQDEFANNDINIFFIEATGTGSNPWLRTDHFIYDRFAQLVGHTHASLQINDILAAIKNISLENCVDPTEIYLWGKDELAVPILYSAIVDSTIAGIVLENMQDKHIGVTPIQESECNTALFNMLKYADIPQSAGLIFPRRIVIAGEMRVGFNWTKDLYRKLGNENEFIITAEYVSEIIRILKTNNCWKN